MVTVVDVVTLVVGGRLDQDFFAQLEDDKISRRCRCRVCCRWMSGRWMSRRRMGRERWSRSDLVVETIIDGWWMVVVAF